MTGEIMLSAEVQQYVTMQTEALAIHSYFQGKL